MTIHLTPTITEVLAMQPLLLVNYSGGKDSETTLHQIHTNFGATHQIEIVYADTGLEYDEEEDRWASTERWIRERAAWYGYPLHIVRHPTTTYPERVLARGRFPSPGQRWCTSDFKRGPITKLIRNRPEPVIISILGMRAAESPFRATLPPWTLDEEVSVSRAKLTGQPRTVYEWLPIHHWGTEEVFAHCAQHNLPLHPVYDWLPSRRFSCQVCIFATNADLAAIRRHNPKAFQRIANMEEQINFTMGQAGTVSARADAWKTQQEEIAKAPTQVCMF